MPYVILEIWLTDRVHMTTAVGPGDSAPLPTSTTAAGRVTLDRWSPIW